MQDIVIIEILKNSLVPYEIGSQIIAALFSVNGELPDCVKKNRPSLLAFNQVIRWGGSVENGIIASIASLNSMHGCFGACYDLINLFFSDASEESFKEHIYHELNFGRKIPGLGSPLFNADNIDGRCEHVKAVLKDLIPSAYEKAMRMEDIVVDATGKEIRLNLAFWNAFCIYIVGLKKEYASLVFLLASQISHINNLQNK